MIIDFNKYNGGSASGVTPEQVQEQIASALTPYWDSGETVDYVDEAISGITPSDPTRLLSVEELPTSAETGTVMALYQEGEAGGGTWEGPADNHYTFNCDFSTLDTAQTYDIAYLGNENDMNERGDIYLKYLNGVWNLYAHVREWGGIDEEAEEDIWTEVDKYIPLTPIVGGDEPAYWGGFGYRYVEEEDKEIIFECQIIVWDGQNIMVGDWNYGDQAWNDISNFQRFLDWGDFRLSNIEGGSPTVMGVYQYDGEEWNEVGADVDLSAYWTSAETQNAISAATAGKADKANVTARDYEWFIPNWNSQGIITGDAHLLHPTLMQLNGAPDFEIISTDGNSPLFYAPTTSGNLGEVLISTGNGAPVWSAVTIPDMSLYTPTSGFSTINGSAITNGGNIVIQGGGGDVTKAYVDSADTALQNQIDTMDEVVSEALVDLNDHIYDVEKVTASALTELHDDILELSGSSVDLSGYYTSGETDAAISAATAGKANAANVEPNSSSILFPSWNSEGIITGSLSPTFSPNISINDRIFQRVTLGGGDWYSGSFYAPESAGTAGEVLVSTGNGAPVWSAMPAADVTKAYVDSAITEVQDQIDTMDDVVSAALVDLNDRVDTKVESSSVSTIWKGTQSQYDAIAPKDASTLYIIVNNS